MTNGTGANVTKKSVLRSVVLYGILCVKFVFEFCTNFPSFFIMLVRCTVHSEIKLSQSELLFWTLEKLADQDRQTCEVLC